MPRRPDGRITEIVSYSRYVGNSLRRDRAAVIVFPSGSRIIKPLWVFPEPNLVEVGMTLRWEDHFGGPFRLLPAKGLPFPEDGAEPSTQDPGPG